MRITLSRRRVIAGTATALPAVALGPGLLTGCSLSNAAKATPGFLDAVAEIVIPGAKAARVGSYMQTAFDHGLFGSPLMSAVALEGYFDRKLRHTFMSATHEEQTNAIRELDAITFGQGPAKPPEQPESTMAQDKAVAMQLWRPAKSAIIVGFYMSEIGASKELDAPIYRWSGRMK